MIAVFFGLPGCGKTTLLSKFAVQGLKRYDHVYGNVQLAVPGYTYVDNDCIGTYDLSDGLILLDEATLYADSRDFKNFKGNKLSYWMQHRHYRNDIYLFVQKWDALDIKIRNLTNVVYWVKSMKHLPISRVIEIPFGIGFESDKIKAMRSKQGLFSRLFSGKSQDYGEIIMGYTRPGKMKMIFCKYIWRPAYYKYFDSWEAPVLPPLPAQYKPYGYVEVIEETEVQENAD